VARGGENCRLVALAGRRLRFRPARDPRIFAGRVGPPAGGPLGDRGSSRNRSRDAGGQAGTAGPTR